MSTLIFENITVFHRARNYLFIFYLLGQNSYNPHSKLQHKFNKLANAIPSIVSSLLSLSISITGCIYRYHYEGFYETTDSVVSYVLLVLQFLTNFVTMLQSLYYSSDIRMLLDKFENVRLEAKQHLHFTISFDEFDKRYRRKVAIVASIYLISLGIKFYFTSTKTHIVVQTAQMILLGLTLMVNLHSLFYIELLLFCLSSTMRCVEEFSRSYCIGVNGVKTIVYDNSAMALKLHYVKRILFLLYDISLIINKQFGWSLLTLLILNFVEGAYSSYWVFLYLNAYHSHLFISTNN